MTNANGYQLAMVDAERAMLSSVWLSGDVEMIRRLHDKDFIDTFNRWLLATLKAIVDAGEPLDAIAVQRRIRGDPKAPPDARAEAFQLLSEHPSPSNKSYYFRVLRMERGRRYLHQICEAARKRDLQNPNEPLETFLWVQQHINQAIEQLKEYENPCSESTSAG